MLSQKGFQSSGRRLGDRAVTRAQRQEGVLEPREVLECLGTKLSNYRRGGASGAVGHQTV